MPNDLPSPITVRAEIASSINYAAWQNSVPILKSLVIENGSGSAEEALQLEVNSSPPFIRGRRWIIDRIAAGGKQVIVDRDIQLDPAYLNGLNEAERGLVEFRLTGRDRLISSAVHEVRVLARDEWGGFSCNGELLAAFVMPNDPALGSLLRTASEILARHGHSPALDGYQSGDPQRCFLLVAALWSAVASRKLTYANPPGSFEEVGQKTRSPKTVLTGGLATCLDSALLFSSAIEAIGMNPVIILVEGHCFAGCWLVEKTLNRLAETDCSEIRKAIAARELVTFETTLVTNRPPARFEDAIKAASELTSESLESGFVAAIDIARARMGQIRPLASHHESSQERTPVENLEAVSLPLPPATAMGPRPVAESEVETLPTTPEGRIDRWQRKLLDLSLRNRLLNFKSTGQSVPLVCPDVAGLEDRLAGGNRMRLISLPGQNPIGPRDADLHRKRSSTDLNFEFAKQALARDEIASLLSDQELSSRLTTIYRSVRNDLSEGGSNTLFLAVGFLRWKQQPDDSRSYRAPLLLIPVKLIRKSAASPFQLVQHEDEVRFNATLIQLLKKDYACDLSRFESVLPTDDSGVDVPTILESVRRSVREIPGFEVMEETALGRFSFAKYLMWKDLVDRVEHLEQNRVVRHLIRNPDQRFDSGSGFIPKAEEIDLLFSPAEIFHPLPADSSQLAAVMAAAKGKDFVLVGPPGTGKSQTIANVIAQILGIGKTVLFVAEKTAALDVVYRRLKEHGLGDCCLELHSNKAERKKFLEQLEKSWINNRHSTGNQWMVISERLKVRRDQLNGYVASLHREYPNGWTAFRGMGLAVQGKDLPPIQFAWPDSTNHDRTAYQGLVSIVDLIGLTYTAICQDPPLREVRVSKWSAAWENRLLGQCQQVRSAGDKLRIALTGFLEAMGVEGKNDCSLEELESINGVAKSLLNCRGHDVRLMFHKQFSRFPAAVKELDSAISAYRESRELIGDRYSNETLETMNLDEIETSWRKAIAGFWPFSWFSKRAVTRLMQTYVASGKANPEQDIAAIRTIRGQLATINESPLANQSRLWNGVDTNVPSLQQQIEVAGQLRSAILAFGEPAEITNRITKALHPAMSGKNSGSSAFEAAAEYRSAKQKFVAAVMELSESIGAMPLTKSDTTILDSSVKIAGEIESNRTLLKRWTEWVGVKQKATAVGLSPLVQEVENGSLPVAELLQRFRAAYAKWWIPKIIDRDPVLQQFQQFKHEDAIADFRRLDDEARKLAASQARGAISHGLPKMEEVPRQSELGLLRHQIGLKRPSKSIRDIISGMSGSFSKLAPCLLMSPLSIAQYLPAEQSLFDIVIFDEASQIPTWDAIGAIARGRQTIVVGDPKQLPPTNFFGRSDDDEENDELQDHEKDLESILDEAKNSGLPTLQLNWHYRSRHESLIAFSNWNYYGNKLITFPAAESADRGVSFVHLSDAIYDRGKSRTNRDEAEAIVRDAVAKMRKNLQLPESRRLTLGVITFNIQQQSLIQDLFDQAQREHPELEWYFSDDRIEPTIVKNLENVQGDERDIIFFSVTFGKDVSGKEISLNFGALNRDGGERRLNVAVTRARQELLVYSSFRGDQLRIERTQARGVLDLKAFLDYAEKGAGALAARIEGSMGGFESPFEQAVAESIEAEGWQVVPQVGVSGFRVDLGIVHPDKPGAFLAGIECDGATYHRSAVARDRDKVRQQVLENLGWNILRIWSPEWWYDCQSARERVLTALTGLLENDRRNAIKSGNHTVIEVAEEDEPPGDKSLS